MESETNYKLDILEKIGESYCLLYFVFGFFTTYSWTCKELDYISDPSEINSFWDSIALGFGLLNMINTGFIIFTNCYNRKHSDQFHHIPNESNILFYILCFPLFIGSLIFLILEVVWSIHASSCLKYTTTGYSIFSIIMEIIFYCFTIVLIISQMNKIIQTQKSSKVNNINKFVIVLAGTGICVFLCFHMTSQQVHNFVQVSSKYPSYQKYFSKTMVANRTSYYLDHSVIRNYMLPLVILFCCSCMSYLITIFYRNNNFSREKGTEIDNIVSSRNSIQDLIQEYNNIGYQTNGDGHNASEINEVEQDQNDLEKKDKGNPSFRLPPMSLVVGILFITLTILLLIITDSFLNTKANLQTTGLLIYTIFPIPIYLISLVLSFMQLYEMKSWPKIEKNVNNESTDQNDKEEDDLNHGIVDKTLIWIGAAGQLIVSLALLKSLAFLTDMETNTSNEKSIYVVSIIEYTLLIVHTIVQSVTLSLAMDRKWNKPGRNSCQEKVCPSVGLLSINLGFFLFSIYAVKVSEDPFYINIPDNLLFLKIFRNGFHTLGETLAILHRLHGALLFGRMAFVTNR